MIQFRDYQETIAKQAAYSLLAHNIAYLAMEVRTGKTITALYAADMFDAHNVLFVTKKKAIPSIEADYECLRPLSYTMTVTNFESAHKVTGKFDLVIIDEAHSIGSFPKPSERAKVLKVLCEGLPIIYLSGTPSPESYSQLYHQLWVSSFSPWNEYKSFYKWAKEFVHVVPKKINGYTINDYNNANQGKIKPCIERFMFTYTQSQAGFNQAIREEIIKVPMKHETNSLLVSLKKDKVAYLGEAAILADSPATLLTKLHQVSSGTVIDTDGIYHIIDRSKAITVRNRFIGQKIAIFYVFKSELEMLKEIFPKWTDSPEEFQASSNKVFLGQFRSAREGVRLDTADALIFFNMEFSYLSWEQAKNRLQSKERTKEAVIYLIQSDCGIEQYVYDAVMSKTDFTLSYYGKTTKNKEAGEQHTGTYHKTA